MSIKERQFYQRTPNGWDSGSFYGNPGPTEEVSVSDDCLLTVECVDDLANPLAGESDSYDRIAWKSDDHDASR